MVVLTHVIERMTRLPPHRPGALGVGDDLGNRILRAARILVVRR